MSELPGRSQGLGELPGASRLEVAICRWVDNPGTVPFVNALALGVWTLLFGAAVAMMLVCARGAAR